MHNYRSIFLGKFFGLFYSSYSFVSKFEVLSNENGGMRHSKLTPSSRSIKNVPLRKFYRIIQNLDFNIRLHFFLRINYLAKLTTYGHLVLADLYAMNIERPELANSGLALDQQRLDLQIFNISLVTF